MISRSGRMVINLGSGGFLLQFRVDLDWQITGRETNRHQNSKPFICRFSHVVSLAPNQIWRQDLTEKNNTGNILFQNVGAKNRDDMKMKHISHVVDLIITNSCYKMKMKNVWKVTLQTLDLWLEYSLCSNLPGGHILLFRLILIQFPDCNLWREVVSLAYDIVFP